MRIITVFQTRGQKRTVIETDVKTFGELQPLLEENGVEFRVKEMVAIESINDTSLELPSAVLPDGDFTLGVFPRKTKAGGDRKELYARIKELVLVDGKDAVNEYFKSKTGKHYTNISTNELETLVDSYGNVASAIVQGKQDVAGLLSSLGVSQSTISAVTNEIQGNKIEVNMDWIEAICENHPLTSC